MGLLRCGVVVRIRRRFVLCSIFGEGRVCRSIVVFVGFGLVRVEDTVVLVYLLSEI